MRDEDIARLSPLGHEHINMLGRYAFSLPDRIARGELRPRRARVAPAYFVSLGGFFNASTRRFLMLCRSLAAKVSAEGGFGCEGVGLDAISRVSVHQHGLIDGVTDGYPTSMLGIYVVIRLDAGLYALARSPRRRFRRSNRVCPASISASPAPTTTPTHENVATASARSCDAPVRLVVPIASGAKSNIRCANIVPATPHTHCTTT